jgi:exopolysaccharide biosynthesis polyprenyl glycosylphosphotransferase
LETLFLATLTESAQSKTAGAMTMEEILNIPAEGIGAAGTFAGRPTSLVRLVSRWRFIACVQTFDAMVFCALSLAWFRILRQPAAEDWWLVHVAVAILSAAMIHCVFHCFRLYEFSMLTRGFESAARASWAAIIAFGPFVAPLLVYREVPDDKALAAGGVVAAGLGAVALARIALAGLAQRLQQSGAAGKRIYIIADSEDGAASLRTTLQPLADTRVVGTWALPPGPVEPSMEGALEFLRNNPTDVVILKIPLSKPDRLLAAARALRGLPRTVLLAPGLDGLEDMIYSPSGSPREGLENLILVKLSERPLFGWRWVIKDIQDRVLALALLVIVAPALLSIAAAIKFSDPGPVFFRQKRYGYAGDTFDIIKFRTMRVADPNEDARSLKLTTRDDPRVFPVGRILRKTSLDELPQLLNVLRGDMWIVGPRPHSPFAKAGGMIYAEAVREYAARYRIKPGITGWAQVCGWRGPTDTLEQLRNRVEHDLYYIEHWSVAFDVRILFKTLFCAFGDKNAF